MKINVRIFYASKLLFFFPRWVAGFTIGRFIFFRKEALSVPTKLLNHEMIHVCQYQEHGIVGFLWRYFWRDRNLKYHSKIFEVEAYAHEYNPGYIRERWPEYAIKIN